MRRLELALALLGIAAAAPVAAAPLDDMARDYVALVLEYGEHEEGYVDAYYGPPEWAEAARASKRSLGRLTTDTAALRARVAAEQATGMDELRRKYLAAQLRALSARIAMKQGLKLDFASEAEELFGVRPVLKPLASYDPVLAKIDKLVPGPGALADRVDAFRKRYEIPSDRLKPVMEAAIAECKARTAKNLPLPDGEKFDLEFVSAKPWSGYNWYKGGYHSLIQINTDLPTYVARAVDLGCHEGYPGHHVYNALLERELVKGRGWTEFAVYPLYSPQSLIAEGSANYGIDLAFPKDEQIAFETKTIYPIAGLNPATAKALVELNRSTRALAGASYTVANDYLAGRLTRDAAKALIQRYELSSPARAEQRMKFIDTYRSYIINYGLGRDLVQAHVESAGKTQAARWQAMTKLLSEPTLPADLRK
ncbi:hypothetical protein ACFOMD_10870 [Sphingoaurantiacus capsulatus]|uniref:DUF885 domain-containing protein n=1 Tax=Sphingoaurantiacus capsulatus TaxID=1771310 RepID=A0ABV7XCW0_9SPHN